MIEGQTLEHFRSEARKSGLKEKDLSFYTPQGAETLPEVYKRIKDFIINHLTKVVNNNDKVLIVTHGGVIREFMRYFRDEFKCDFKGQEIMRVTPNTAINTFQILIDSNQKLKVECIQLHDCNHLEENSNIINDKSSEDNTNAFTLQAL